MSASGSKKRSSTTTAWVMRNGLIIGRELTGLGRRPENEPMKPRSEEHTSELQSQSNLVCRLLLEKNILSNSSAGAHTLFHTIPDLTDYTIYKVTTSCILCQLMSLFLCCMTTPI